MKMPEPKLTYKPEDVKFDPCPWHRDTQPTFGVELVGHRDESSISVYARCPKCGVRRSFTPTEKEGQDHYESRYSHNHRMLRHLLPKLMKIWNWNTP